MEPIIKFLRAYAPGYENCYLLSSASLIGVRETRHFAGVETITEQDIQEARIFEDWVVTKAHFNFDVHNMTGNGLDAIGSQETFKQVKGYTISYGCLGCERWYLTAGCECKADSGNSAAEWSGTLKSYTRFHRPKRDFL